MKLDHPTSTTSTVPLSLGGSSSSVGSGDPVGSGASSVVDGRGSGRSVRSSSPSSPLVRTMISPTIATATTTPMATYRGVRFWAPGGGPAGGTPVYGLGVPPWGDPPGGAGPAEGGARGGPGGGPPGGARGGGRAGGAAGGPP